MDELLYLLLGWLLGLLSPRIIDAIKARYDRTALIGAIKEEAQDLQYRVAASCFLLRQRYGEITREYLEWLKPKLLAYRGNEPVDSVRQFVEVLLNAPDEQLAALAERMQAQPGVGLSLKTFNSGFIESNLAALHSLPIPYQRCIHEFRNQLVPLNQEIERAADSLRMTYDSSITDENHERLVADLRSKYVFIEGMCRRVCDRLQAVIDYGAKKT